MAKENEITTSEQASMGVGRRQMLKTSLGMGAAAALAPVLAACGSDAGSGANSSGTDPEAGSDPTDNPGGSDSSATGEAIKVGFMTDLTGITANLGDIQDKCFNLAVNQINSSGGIAGRPIEFITEDTGADSTQTIEKATKLALEDEVVAVIGLITSLVREAALTVLPSEKVPLLYTTYYEGAASGAVACDPYLIGTGQVPNQQIEPLVPYLTENVGTTYTVVGSDYIWARGTTEVLEELVAKEGGNVKSSTFYPFGTTDFGPFFQQLEEDDPDICWVTLAGTDFSTFLKQYEQFGATAKLVSPAMDEVFAATSPGTGVGTLTSQSYFSTVDNDENTKFLEDYQAAYGEDALVNSIGEATYNAVWILKEAIEAADGDSDPEKWIPKLSEVDFASPSGTIGVDADTQHAVSNNYIGELTEEGTIRILETSEGNVPQVNGCVLS